MDNYNGIYEEFVRSLDIKHEEKSDLIEHKHYIPYYLIEQLIEYILNKYCEEFLVENPELAKQINLPQNEYTKLVLNFTDKYTKEIRAENEKAKKTLPAKISTVVNNISEMPWEYKAVFAGLGVGIMIVVWAFSIINDPNSEYSKWQINKIEQESQIGR